VRDKNIGKVAQSCLLRVLAGKSGPLAGLRPVDRRGRRSAGRIARPTGHHLGVYFSSFSLMFRNSMR
jgi:hypothetical protein